MLRQTGQWALLIMMAVGTATAFAPDREARAGSFDLYRFVNPGSWAVGVEPEFILTHGAGFGGNLKFTYGATELNNLTGIIGTGGGDHKFRVGGNFTFDIIPDIDKQPGIGIALQAIYYRIAVPMATSGVAAQTVAQLELTAIPYLHKAFKTAAGTEFEPFVTFPVGLSLNGGQYLGLTSLAVGSMFKSSEHFRYVVELGIAINHTDSYISGGVVYYQ